MAKRMVTIGFVVAIIIDLVGGISFAGFPMGQRLAESVIYSIIGLIVLLLGYMLFDFVSPFSLEKEIKEDDNVACGVIIAGLMIALGIIIHAAIAV